MRAVRGNQRTELQRGVHRMPRQRTAYVYRTARSRRVHSGAEGARATHHRRRDLVGRGLAEVARVARDVCRIPARVPPVALRDGSLCAAVSAAHDGRYSGSTAVWYVWAVGTHTHGSFVDRTRITVAALPPCRTDEYTSLHHGGGSAGSRDGVVGQSGLGPGRGEARREAGFDSGYRVYFAAASSGVPHEYEPRESTPSTQRPLRNAILTHTCTRAGQPGWFPAPSSAVTMPSRIPAPNEYSSRN